MNAREELTKLLMESYDRGVADAKLAALATIVQVVSDEREACANIDWATILRHGGIVTRGDAETLADLVTAAIRARGQK